MKRPLRTLLPCAATIVVLTALAADAIGADPTLSRQDRQGGVTVTATPVPSPTGDGPLRIKVVLDTHSVVALPTPDGGDLAPVAIEQAKGGGHHREAVAVFAAVGDTARLRLVVKGVGGVGERLFTWELPASR